MPHSEDVYEQMAALHADALDQGFLAKLGPRFLTLLYKAIDADPATHLIVKQQDGRVLGFVAGGPGMGPVYHRLLASWPSLVRALAPQILSRTNILGLIELFLYRKRQGASNATLPEHELLVIAVDSRCRGTGIATLLYRSLADAFKSEGVSQFKIVVGPTLETAHRFYRKMGATPKSETFVHGGAASLIYVATCTSARLY